MVSLVSAQFQNVSITQINASSATDLSACVDTSAYMGDTITTMGVVVIDGNLSEVSSGSITGGSRPFISIVEPSNGAAAGPFRGLIIMGVNADGSNTPNSAIENVLAGDTIVVTGIVGGFNGALQLQPLGANSVTVLGFTNAPTYATVPVSDLQDGTRQNVLTTGEQWDGSYVEIQNVTVTSVSTFSGGSRTEFTVEDANGNQILVADRFLPMRLAGNATVNPNSPLTTGTAVAPSVGTVYNYIRGLIFQDENGCAGGSSFAGGYEMNPFDTLDIDKAASPPQITNLMRMPQVPNATQSATISSEIVDNDGTVVSATLFYTSDMAASANTFSSVAMTATGSIYSATIPAFPLDSVVRYYIEAIDDSSNVSTSPGGNSYHFYTVRANGMNIVDLQYFLPNGNGDSPYSGDTVTVTGIVTSSYQPGDLGYLYVQDATATEYAGIFVNGGGTAVFSLNRGDEITINGIVQEQFGFTNINALTVTTTGNTGSVSPVVLNPSDTNLFTSANRNNLEKYESMLVRYENPMAGGKVNIINANLGFGEFTVGSGVGATTDARVITGRQSGTSAQSSLNVSVTSDSAQYASGMNVAAVQATTSQNMDAIQGFLYYSFSNFKLVPRDNNDIIGFSQPLVSIETISTSAVATSIYPNPAEDRVNVQLDATYKFDVLNIQVVDMAGRVVVDQASSLHLSSINLSGLEKGFYIIRVSENNQLINSSKLILR